jgi:hypothetical protein
MGYKDYTRNLFGNWGKEDYSAGREVTGREVPLIEESGEHN